MKQTRTFCLLALSFALSASSNVSANAIGITYSLTGVGTVQSATDTTLTLVAQAGGSVLSGDPGLNAAWNPVTYSDQSVLDLTTGLLKGNFSMTFANGDALLGHIFEDDSAVTDTGPFTQTLTFTGGTGEFAGATGSVSGNGFIGTTTFTVSGSGTVNAPAVPEPASAALLLGGLALLIAKRTIRKLLLAVLSTPSQSKLILFLALAIPLVSVSADPLVYVISGTLTGGGQFGVVDLTTGAFTQIGPGEPDGYFGLTPGPNGSLLSLTYASNLDSINPATGVPTRVGPTGLPGCVIPTPSCSPTTAFSLGGFAGTIYATDIQSNLYTVNPLTGAAMLLSQGTGLPASPFVPGSQNPDGTLNFVDEAIWGSSGKLYITYDAWIFDPTTGQNVQTVVAPKLYQVDPATGLAAALGPTDLGIGGATDVNGTTYAFNDVTNQVVSLDLANGQTSFVTDFDPAAGVIQGTAPVPEPAPIALAVVGAVLIVTSNRLRKHL